MKYFIKYRITIIEIIILLIFGITIYFTIDSDADCFENFIKDYFDIKTKYQLIDKPKVVFQTLPVMIFFFFHGIFFYKEWSIDNIYNLIRYDKRKKCCIKNLLSLLLVSILISLIFIASLCVIYILKSGNSHIDMLYFLSIFLSMSAVFYYMALLFSFISINFGSLYGCFSTFIIWSLLVVFSLYISYECDNKFLLFMFRVIFPSVEEFYYIISEDHSYSIYIITFLQIAALIIVNTLYTNKIDIGLTDKEAE